MIRYLIFIFMLLQCTPLGISENSKSRIEIRNRYIPGKIKLHSPHQLLVSPINLLNPDKYEYFTINNQGNIIKRLMTSKEIQSIVAGNNVRQNVFDKLDSPNGIITNIVSSIKNVLNTELLSKHQESQNYENLANENIAEVSSNESLESENVYIPAVLNLVENSSQYEESSNKSTTKCTVNCGSDNNFGVEATAVGNYQTEPTEVSTEYVTVDSKQQIDESKIDNTIQWLILNNNKTDLQSTPEQMKEYSTDSLLLSTINDEMFVENSTETSSYQGTEPTTGGNLILSTSESSSVVVDETTEYTKEIAEDRITFFTVQNTFKDAESLHVTTSKPDESMPILSVTEESSMPTSSNIVFYYPFEETSEQILSTTTLVSDPFSETSTLNPSTSVITSTHVESSSQPNTISTASEADQPSTIMDIQMKVTSLVNNPDSSTELIESTTNIVTEEYSWRKENISSNNKNTNYNGGTPSTEVYSTSAESYNKPESTTNMALPTNFNPNDQLQDESTTLTADTQNAFYMIMELLKDNHVKEDSHFYQPAITDSLEKSDENEYDDEEYSTIPQKLTTTPFITDIPSYADHLALMNVHDKPLNSFESSSSEEQTHLTTLDDIDINSTSSSDEQSHLTTLDDIEINSTSRSDEQSHSTTLDDIEINSTPLTTTLKTPITVWSTTLSTAKMPTFSPNKVPSKPEQTIAAEVFKPSSNEFVSIAEMILRQTNTVPQTENIQHTNVNNLLGLLTFNNKHMINYVDETATVASIISHAPLKPQSQGDEPSENAVLQSFLSITNDLNQGLLPPSAEDANGITNTLFQKLGESEARRNISSDILLTNDNEEEYLEESIEDDQDETKELTNFFKLCNKIGMDMYKSIRSHRGLQQLDSFAFSPFSAISLLSMLYLGARGKTADKINKLIGLDEMTSFNPHTTFKTISQAIEEENINSYFVRMLFSDEKGGKLQTFFKTKVTQLYSGYAEEISFNDQNVIANRINMLVNNSTQGAHPDFLKNVEIHAAPPLSLISANSFELKCPSELDVISIFFHIIDLHGKRKLIELAAAAYSGSFLFGYNAETDVTIASIFSESRDISTIFLMPGQQGGIFEKNSLMNLENNIFSQNVQSNIQSLEQKLKPHLNSVLLIPHVYQQTLTNISEQLHNLGLGELFNNSSSNLKGIQETTASPIFLSDVLLIDRVSVCNAHLNDKISNRYTSSLYIKNNLNKNLEKTPNAKGNDALKHNENVLKLDKPFIYIIRHNPSQLILYVGRFNPLE